MRKVTLAAIVVITMSGPAQAQSLYSVHTYNIGRRPPEAWSAQDAAVTLYRAARNELNDHNFARAAELFGRIIEKYPRSTYAPDAYYWQAFALYSNEDYEEARDILVAQQKKYPKAATAGDAAQLLTRIRGELAKQGDPGSAEKITREAKGATQGCPKEDDEGDLRITALNAFLNMDSERALPLLKQIMARRDECSVVLRRKAVFLISQKRGPDVEDVLLSAARNDPDKEVRSQAVFWLSQVHSEKAIGYLEDILKTSTDEETRDKAIFAISQHGGARALQILRDYASTTSYPTELRGKAIFWIGQRNDADAGTYLKQLYAKEPNQELKEKIIFSISQRRGNEPWLMELATNESESIEMRKKALFWAGQSRGTPMADLLGLYERMKSRDMKEQLIFVYSQRREPAAIDKMMSIAKTETDRELRKKAIFWLSQSKDPRVADFLMQLINQ